MLWKHLSASPHWSWWFIVRLGQLCINSGVWDVVLTYIPIEDIAVFSCGFSSQIPYLIWGLTL